MVVVLMPLYLTITKMIDYNRLNENLQTEFVNNKGKGLIFAYPPLNIGNLLIGTLCKLIHKRPEEKVLIVIGEYKYKEDILKSIREKIDLEESIFIENHLQFLSQSYAFTKLYLYTVNILIGIESPDFIRKSYTESKFTLCIITNSSIKLNVINTIRSFIPVLNIGIEENDLQLAKINTPVKEYRHPIYFTEEEQKQYDKYSSFIKDSMVVFEQFENVEFCRNGNKITGASAMQCCTELAYRNGWNKELDMSIEFNVQIDRIYNPNAIHERAQLIYNITRERKNFVCNATAKIKEVIKIIKANPFKRVVIVNKSGDFANEIAESLIKENLFCGLFHNDIPSSYMPDENGNYIVYKSGINKGKPKLFKADALSTYWMQCYLYGNINILSIKSASDVKLAVPIDIVIFTTTLVDDIFKFKARFRNCEFPDNTTEIHRVYVANTIEENAIYNERPTNLIIVCNSETIKDISINAETGEINL